MSNTIASRTTGAARAAAILALGVLALAPPVCAQNDDFVGVRIIVEDHSGMTDPEEPLPPLFMASSLTGWDPAGIRPLREIRFQPEGSKDWVRAWQFETTYRFVTSPGLEFKFTRGDWSTVEVAADGSDIANREIAPEQITHDDRAGNRIFLRIEGFADQRGTRWPAAPGAHGATVTGELDVFTVSTEHLERRPTIRVWLPPGYNDAANAQKRYAVMYMHDGQNLFDEATSFIGVEWGVDEAATKLIEAGKIPPIIVVGIDNAGPDRAGEYNPPYTEWEGRKNFADRYVAFLADDLMPLINERYRTRTGAEHTGLGGSSFGGAVTLYALMERPDLFSRALVESPAVFVSDGALVEHLRDFKGPYPDRVFIGVGTREVEDAERSAAYVSGAREIAAILTSAGVKKDDVRLVVEPDAIHNESAWARRLPDALEFLWGDTR